MDKEERRDKACERQQKHLNIENVQFSNTTQNIEERYFNESAQSSNVTQDAQLMLQETISTIAVETTEAMLPTTFMSLQQHPPLQQCPIQYLFGEHIMLPFHHPIRQMLSQQGRGPMLLEMMPSQEIMPLLGPNTYQFTLSIWSPKELEAFTLPPGCIIVPPQPGFETLSTWEVLPPEGIVITTKGTPLPLATKLNGKPMFNNQLIHYLVTWPCTLESGAMPPILHYYYPPQSTLLLLRETQLALLPSSRVVLEPPLDIVPISIPGVIFIPVGGLKPYINL